MNFESWFAQNYPEIPLQGALVVLRLTAEGATIPFIARYRKEQTGNLDEVAIQRVVEAKAYWDDVEKRKEFIISEIEAQGKMTPELKDTIQKTYVLSTLEDIYLPFKKKKKTRATVAKEAGLEPLADWMWKTGRGEESFSSEETLELKAAAFVSEEKNVKDVTAAIEGAQHIIIERLSEMQELRQFVRSTVFDTGFLTCERGEKVKPNSKFENYFEFHESIQSLMNPQASHRYLAMRRGEAEEELRLAIGGKPGDEGFEQNLIMRFEAEACPKAGTPGDAVLRKAARYALKYHVLYSISAEVHAALKEVADDAAIKVFAENVRTVLLSAPYGAKTVLGVDPGVRTGCKLALVDQSGTYVSSTVLHTQSPGDRERAKELIKELKEKADLRAIAVGNGTAGRETESFFRQIVQELGVQVAVVMVSEAGASVYSASEVARDEFPDLDLTVRGAISIARRMQDPLAELVKVDPKSIGVGQYQHDVSPVALKKSLERVVEHCVNSVGVNLNTASQHLLAYVSGIGPSLAKNIVEHRAKNGLFKSRKQLLEVGRFGSKAFEQAAGFLRIPGGDHPLDNTGVHPERYEVLEQYANKKGREVSDLLGAGVEVLKADSSLKSEFGEYTYEDIVRELEKPGRDPREEFAAFEFLQDVHDLKDLKPGMICPGIVTNVTNFGAFVDIGVHQDGLVHISQLSDSFVKDPKEVVNPGDRVKVRVLEVNIEKKQISLSMKKEGSTRPQQRPQRSEEQPRRSQGERQERGGRPQVQKGGGAPKKGNYNDDSFKNNPFAALASLSGKGERR